MVHVAVHDGIQSLSRSPLLDVAHPLLFSAHLFEHSRFYHKMLMGNVAVHDGILSLSRSPVLDVAYPPLLHARWPNIP